jgi:hypothetical protein
MTTTQTIAILVAALATACGSSSDDRSRGSGSAAHELPVPRKLPAAAPPRPAAGHAASIDDSYSTVTAMYKAPEGATPCESAYNAIAAEQDAAQATKHESIFKFVAAKDEFSRVCQALPAASQACLVPRYQARHRVECANASASSQQLEKLYVLRPDLDQTAEPDPLAAP